MRRSLIAAAAIAASIAPAVAAAPKSLWGKSITVAWTETRSQRDVGEAAFKPVSLPYTMQIYISTEGRTFNRVTSVSASRRRTGSNEGVGAGSGAMRKTADRTSALQIQGNTIVHNVSSGGLGRQTRISVDGGGSSCSAQVVTAKVAGARTATVKSVATGGMVEFESVSAGAASCSISDGNVFSR